jgi:hypothetical protein
LNDIFPGTIRTTDNNSTGAAMNRYFEEFAILCKDCLDNLTEEECFRFNDHSCVTFNDAKEYHDKQEGLLTNAQLRLLGYRP